MIARISGEGQYRLDGDDLGKLNELDNAAVAAVEAGDEPGFRRFLADMLALIRTQGEAVPDDELANSDVIVPPEDTTLEEAREEFSGEGLIPD